jgi:hypothetical protein
MLKTSISGTQNGVNASFTLGQAPIPSGIAMVVHQGKLLKRVTGTPSGLEYVLSGTALTVGTPPASGDMFFAYIQVSATQSYAQTTVTGLQIPSNVVFTIADTPVVGSSVLFIKNGLVLEETSGVLSATQFSITGTTITLGAPLVASDVMQVFTSQIASAVLSVLPFTGALNGLNTRYTLGYAAPLNYEPELLVVLDGMIQARVISNPLTNQYAFVDTKSIRLGTAPNAAAKLQLFLLGVTLLSTNPYSFTCERLAQRIAIWVQRRAETTEIEEAVKQVYDELTQSYQWTFLQIDGMFATEAIKETGTVIATAGSRVITGIGTAFTATDKGKRFRAGDSHASYEIMAVDAVKQTLEIHPPFIG